MNKDPQNGTQVLFHENSALIIKRINDRQIA